MNMGYGGVDLPALIDLLGNLIRLEGDIGIILFSAMRQWWQR